MNKSELSARSKIKSSTVLRSLYIDKKENISKNTNFL